MKKHLIPIIGAALIAAALACGLAIPAAAPGPVQRGSQALTQAAAASQAPSEPGIPAVVDHVYLGIPAGNGYNPHQVTVDSGRARAYTLNYGSASPDRGNTLSVLDTRTGKVIRLIRLRNMGPEELTPPYPLDLQLDAYRPRLYVLWGNRYGDAPYGNLTVVDAEALTVLETLPGVEALAAGPDRLYLAGGGRLWTADPDSLAELAGRELEGSAEARLLRLNLEADRLYLARAYPGSLDVFEAGTLAPLASRPVADRVMEAAVEPGGERVWVLESEADQVVLRALNAEGERLAQPEALPVSDNIYSDLPMALRGQTMYLAGDDYQDYRLEAYRLPNLDRRDSLPLPSPPYDLAVDETTGRVYAAYQSWSDYVLAIDPETGSTQPLYTALAIRDALADPAAGRLYVLDDGGSLAVRDLGDLDPVASVETGFNILDADSTGYGELSTDPGRGRLYIGGDPVRIVDTGALTVAGQLDGRGQITPDPTGDRLYLTPPCMCRVEQCNTLILDAETLTGTQTIFPPQDPFMAPCVEATQLDVENQLLYARIYNGIPGSNSGNYYTVLDVAGRPEPVFTTFDISYGKMALDPGGERAFAPRYRIAGAYIERFGAVNGGITHTLTLAGAAGQLAYDPAYDRLYAAQQDRLQVFDGELALLAEISLPGEFYLRAFDAGGGRLYLADEEANLLVVATGGGRLEPPPPPAPEGDAPQVQQLVAAPDGTLFRVYGGRLYRSEDGGRNWKLLGRGLPGRQVAALAVSPNYAEDAALLAALSSWSGLGAGLFRSTDGGDTWRPSTRGLTDLQVTHVVNSPTFSRDETIFLTAADAGLFRSTDGGESWLGLADRYAEDVYDRDLGQLAVSPAYADDRLVIIAKDRLLRSDDGGDSWTDTGVPGGLVAFSPHFAEDSLILSAGQWRSTDRGRTWQPAAAGREPGRARQSLFSPDFADDRTVYLVIQPDDGTSLRLQRSVDAGGSWTSLLGGLPAGFETAAVALLPGGELQLAGQDGRELALRPEELDWGRAELDMARFEWQALAVASDGALFVANSVAGVFKSTDGGRTWTDTDFPARSERGLQHARLAAAEDGSLLAAAGAALMRSDDGGETWTHLASLPPGFEVASLAVSPAFAEDGVVLVGGNTAGRRILRSTDRGDSWEEALDAAALEVQYAAELPGIAFSPDFAADGTAYAWLQDGGLLRSTDRGMSWSLAWASDAYLQSMAAAPSGGRLYAGTLYGGLLVSGDGGNTWRDVGGNVPDERSWSTALALAEDGTVFLGTDRGVYRSADGGETWSRASAGLPDQGDGETPAGIRALAYHAGRLYAAPILGGLFVSEDGGDSWRSTLTGRPASPLSPIPVAPTPATATPAAPEVAAAPDCPAPPDYFADLWRARAAELGCPVTAQRTLMAEQSFEGGRMVWRSDIARIYVLPAGRAYADFADTWNDSQPAYLCPELGPPQTPPTPQRGFGKVWCTESTVRAQLGNATGQERAFDAVLQEFETGLIFSTDQGTTYVLEEGGNAWEHIE
jgi:photosystem II stability/assembly factor-like uncharacterized protein